MINTTINWFIKVRVELATVKFMVLALLITPLSGCIAPAPKPNDPRFAPVIPISKADAPLRNGAIFQVDQGVFLYEDKKAGRVGDIITIQLAETTVSTKSSATSYSKENATNMTSPTLFGQSIDLNLPNKIKNNLPFGSSSGLTLGASMNGTRDFDGEADSDRSNSLLGSITVTVSEVLPNGNLRVRGEKWMTLNEGNEYIRITGIIRPQDISPSNTIISTRIADARISYSGTGVLANANKTGWFARHFVSPFWPY